jgi:hypothetical protein
VGLAVGLVAGTLLPNAPLHAVSNDRSETFAICTAPLNEEVEAIWFLDFLTGDLKAAVINPQSGAFTALFQRNIMADMSVDASKTPRYSMVSGMVEVRRAMGNTRLSKGMVYVAEANSGRIGVFAIPYSQQMLSSGRVVTGQVQAMGMWPARTAAVRPGGN